MDSLKKRLLKMSFEELEEELIESSGNYIKELVIKKIIEQKERKSKNMPTSDKINNGIKNNNLTKSKKVCVLSDESGSDNKKITGDNNKKNKKNNEEMYRFGKNKEYLREEDFLDDILTIEDNESSEGDKYAGYDPVLLNEVKKDSINNRVMDRMNSDIFIKKTPSKKRKIESPYIENYNDDGNYYENPNNPGLDPYDFSNRRFMRD